jgi:hypothetical protein
MRNGLGRTVLPQGTDDVLVAASEKPDTDYSAFYVAFPSAGQTTLFRDKSGRWNAGLFGNDRTAPFRAMPGFVPVEIQDTGDDLLIFPAHDN